MDTDKTQSSPRTARTAALVNAILSLGVAVVISLDADPSLMTKDVVIQIESRRALLPFAGPFRKVELVLGGLAGRPDSLALRPPLGLKRSQFVDLINSRTLEAERHRLALPYGGPPDIP